MQMLNLFENRGRNRRGIRFENKVAQGMQRQLEFVVFQKFIEQVTKRLTSFSYQH